MKRHQNQYFCIVKRNNLVLSASNGRTCHTSSLADKIIEKAYLKIASACHADDGNVVGNFSSIKEFFNKLTKVVPDFECFSETVKITPIVPEAEPRFPTCFVQKLNNLFRIRMAQDV